VRQRLLERLGGPRYTTRPALCRRRSATGLLLLMPFLVRRPFLVVALVHRNNNYKIKKYTAVKSKLVVANKNM